MRENFLVRNFFGMMMIVVVVMVVIFFASVLNAVENIFGAVASPDHALLDDMLGDSLQIVGLSDVRHRLNEDRGEIDFPAQLRGTVVPREGVVVVVEACKSNHERLFPGDPQIGSSVARSLVCLLTGRDC